jgi:hypothetical protein
MRDICQCESNGCQAKGGVQLDTRTIQKHRCKDQLRIFENARADSEHALEEQVDHISHHLSNLQLTNSRSHSPAQTTSTTNDLCHQLTNLSLNSNEAPSTKDHCSKTSTSPSQRSTIQDVLTHLSSVEAAAAALRNNSSASKNVSHPTLDSLLRECYSLQSSVSKVTLKAAPVTAKKEDISKILSTIQVQLEAQKSELLKKRKLALRPAAPVYLTGMAFIGFVSNI